MLKPLSTITSGHASNYRISSLLSLGSTKDRDSDRISCRDYYIYGHYLRDLVHAYCNAYQSSLEENWRVYLIGANAVVGIFHQREHYLRNGRLTSHGCDFGGHLETLQGLNIPEMKQYIEEFIDSLDLNLGLELVRILMHAVICRKPLEAGFDHPIDLEYWRVLTSSDALTMRRLARRENLTWTWLSRVRDFFGRDSSVKMSNLNHAIYGNYMTCIVEDYCNVHLPNEISGSKRYQCMSAVRKIAAVIHVSGKYVLNNCLVSESSQEEYVLDCLRDLEDTEANIYSTRIRDFVASRDLYRGLELLSVMMEELIDDKLNH